MPRQPDRYFGLVCTDRELRKHLKVCRNSDFKIVEDRQTGTVTVFDGEAIVLRAERFGDGWLARLHRWYYRHPLRSSSSDDALPGVP
jgi:hypothetical protein